MSAQEVGMGFPDWWEEVVGEVKSFQREHPANLPGAVIAAETIQDGRLIASVGEDWSHNTICEIGSMTKPFISAALLLALEERDMLDIEMPVHKLPGMELYGEDPIKRQIRLRHVLQHTSGLPHFLKYTEWPATACNDPAGGPPFCQDPDLDLGPVSDYIGAPALTNECISKNGACRPARTLSLDDVSYYVLQTYPVTSSPPPGTQYSYSTVNYVLAARIIEKLAGKSVNLYIREKLFAPLVMKDSFFVPQKTGEPKIDAWMDDGVSDEQRQRIADLVLITRDGNLPAEMAPGPNGGWDKFRTGWRFVNPDGGMFSTANDLLNFLRMLRDGGVFQMRRVLSSQIVNLLIEDQGHSHTMGFGYRSQPTPYGQSAGTIEHMGYKMTYFWYDPRPENPLIGVFLSQRLPSIAVNINIGDGLHAIFRVFVSAVKSKAFGAKVSSPA
jgi:CubicO group peptidase (beta-lactamase class C family)